MPENLKNVSEITQCVRKIIWKNSDLENVWMCGKISNVKFTKNGTLNFILTDNNDQIECVIFKDKAPLQKELPVAGSNVFVKGEIYVYGNRSEYRFMVTDVKLPENPLPDPSVSISTLTKTLKTTLSAHSQGVQGEISDIFVTPANYTILKLKNITVDGQFGDIIECTLPPEVDPPFPIETGKRVYVKGQLEVFDKASAYRIKIDNANNITPIPGEPALNKCKGCQQYFSKLQERLCHICYDAGLTSEGIVVGAVMRYFESSRFTDFSTEREYTIPFSAKKRGRADVVLRQENSKTLVAIAECKRIGYDGNDGIDQLHAYLSANGTTLGLFVTDTDPYEWTYIKNLGQGNFDEISRSQFEKELGVEPTPGIQPGKTRLELIQANIVNAEVDAIVTTASAQLIRVPGVDSEIREEAGEEIDSECQEIIEREGFRPQGQVEITTGGNLPAKHIIHAIGPIFAGGKQHEAEILACCYENSLEVAVENGINSIAFPAISTGNYGFPIEEATPIALNTVKEFVEQAHQNNEMVPEHIQFVLFDEEAYNCYVKELANLGLGISCLIG